MPLQGRQDVKAAKAGPQRQAARKSNARLRRSAGMSVNRAGLKNKAIKANRSKPQLGAGRPSGGGNSSTRPKPNRGGRPGGGGRPGMGGPRNRDKSVGLRGGGGPSPSNQGALQTQPNMTPQPAPGNFQNILDQMRGGGGGPMQQGGGPWQGGQPGPGQFQNPFGGGNPFMGGGMPPGAMAAGAFPQMQQGQMGAPMQMQQGQYPPGMMGGMGAGMQMNPAMGAGQGGRQGGAMPGMNPMNQLAY